MAVADECHVFCSVPRKLPESLPSFFPSIGQSSVSKIAEKFQGRSIKITLGHGRIRFPFRAEKSLDISAGIP